MDNNTQSIATMSVRAYARITHIATDDRTLIKRYNALGIRVGKRVYIVRKSLSGKTIQIRIGTTDIILRAGPAAHIHVE